MCLTIVQKLDDLSIPYIVLSGENATAIDREAINRITNGHYRAIFMTPEIIFENHKIKGLWRDVRWRELLLAVVIDEVHCVEKWGRKFRPHYARLGELRALAPGVPFVGLTATLTDTALTQTKDMLFLSNAQVIQVTDIRTNIRLEVQTFPGRFHLKCLGSRLDQQKTIVYFETITLVIAAFEHLNATRPDLQGKIEVYYSTLDVRYKANAMRRFMNNEAHVLLATEAAGMGCDVPDVVRVIQFG